MTLWWKGEHNQTPLSQNAALKAREGVYIQTYTFLANLHFLSKTAGATSHLSSLPFQHGAKNPPFSSEPSAKEGQKTKALPASQLMGEINREINHLQYPRCFVSVIWNDILIYFDFDFLILWIFFSFSKWLETSNYQVILKPWRSLILFEPYKKGH